MNLKSRKLRLAYDGGQVDGRSRTISKTYSNLSHEAQDSQILEAAQALVGLQTRTINEIIKVDESVLA